MARLGYLMVDGLAFVLAGIGLTAAVMGQAPKLPTSATVPPAAPAALAEPVTTGALTPKGDDVAASKAVAQPGPVAGSAGGAARVWVDPPHRWTAAGRGEPAIDQATGLRLPRP
ncbi:hypothetical protein MMSR116_18880 [Methylobacterium mesophilicum SR1.6/6]|uniref:Uncharacterized protein n=1 Tax=Methylobacterium mesophilicum SR1.6/6 TaxID=908290 RepID=A0A6B9FMB8_9HYPH|nr:hypothetical protein [Methylobacterium mesophilicum]QGY03730.1 hypothetical protein MMSR116_18880 [Methylobacterium mesophilicum SR1.6/6]